MAESTLEPPSGFEHQTLPFIKGGKGCSMFHLWSGTLSSDCRLPLAGNLVSYGQLGVEESDSDLSEDEEFEYVDDDIRNEEGNETYKLELIVPLMFWSFIALFSPPSLFELFFLCKVFEFDSTSEDMIHKIMRYQNHEH